MVIKTSIKSTRYIILKGFSKKFIFTNGQKKAKVEKSSHKSNIFEIGLYPSLVRYQILQYWLFSLTKIFDLKVYSFNFWRWPYGPMHFVGNWLFLHRQIFCYKCQKIIKQPSSSLQKFEKKTFKQFECFFLIWVTNIWNVEKNVEISA